MSNFRILEEEEKMNFAKKNLRKKKIHKLIVEHVVEKKYVAENRPALKSMDNGVRQENKRLRLCNEEKIEFKEVISLDDSFKENVPEVNYINEVTDDMFINEKLPTKQSSNEEEAKCCLSDKILFADQYREDIWQYLQCMERTIAFPRSKYMLRQSDLSWTTRSILIDWLASVATEYKMCNETLHLSVNYVDRFLSKVSVMKTKFQLVGAAAMWLAGKMEEIYPIDVKEWSYLTGDTFTTRQIKKMEQFIARILKFQMQPPTMCTFIEHFCHEHNLNSKTMHLAMYISELVLLEGDEYLNHVPSKLAAASIAVARYNLSEDTPWPKKFSKHCGYSLRELSPVVQKQQLTFSESPLKDQQSIQKKYKSDKYQKVALVKPRKLLLENLGED